jgi:dTDP-4-amino-4,6-dideoxygalactose transaminase
MAITSAEHVPFVDLSPQYNKLQARIDEAIAGVFSRKSFILGPEVEEFEKAFADYCGTQHCITVSNGTAALHLALLGLGIGSGDEVITTANSFIATAEAISFSGATPVLVDVDPATLNIDCSQIERHITARTKAIMPVHLYGQPADLDQIRDIAKKHRLLIIEDACQAHGAFYKNARIGSESNVASAAVCFSFYPGKNLGAAGDGGAIVTSNAELARRLRLLRSHGSEQKYHHELLGHNFRLDSLQAAILSVKLPYLDEWNEQRRSKAEFYNSQLKGMSGVDPLATIAGVVPVYHLYIVKLADRSIAEKIFKEHNVGYGIHYPVPIHKQPAYKDTALSEASFPVSEHACNSILSLPMFPELTRTHQERVISALEASSAAFKKA